MSGRAITTLVFLITANSAAAQDCDSLARRTPVDSAARPVAEESALPQYEMRQVSADDIRRLRSLLVHGCWRQARQLYFTTYVAEITDWVVYVDSSGKVTQSIDSRRRDVSQRKVMHGERFIYVVVFSDARLRAENSPKEQAKPQVSLNVRVKDTTIIVSLAPPAVASEPPNAAPSLPTDSLIFSRRVVAYQRDPALATLIASLGRGLGVVAPAEPSLNDSSQAVALLPISATPAQESMFVGVGRLGLIDNAQFEMSLKPVPGRSFARPANALLNRLDGIYTNFANAREHLLEAAIVPAVTFGTRPPITKDTTITGHGPNVGVGVYVVGTANLRWWDKPNLTSGPSWRRSSLGVLVGTNILGGGGIGDQLLMGATLGHLVGDTGLAFAMDLTPEAVAAPTGGLATARHRRWLVGLELPF